MKYLTALLLWMLILRGVSRGSAKHVCRRVKIQLSVKVHSKDTCQETIHLGICCERKLLVFIATKFSGNRVFPVVLAAENVNEAEVSAVYYKVT